MRAALVLGVVNATMEELLLRLFFRLSAEPAWQRGDHRAAAADLALRANHCHVTLAGECHSALARLSRRRNDPVGVMQMESNHVLALDPLDDRRHRGRR